MGSTVPAAQAEQFCAVCLDKDLLSTFFATTFLFPYLLCV